MLARGQRQYCIAVAEHARYRIELQRAATIDRRLAALRTAQQRLDARFQLNQFERLGQVIVRTKIQPLHPVLQAAACSQDQYRCFAAAGAQTLQDFQSVHFRQAQVQYHQGILLGVQQTVGVGAVHGALDRPMCILQRLGQPAR